MKRVTWVAHDRISTRALRLQAARDRQHGVQIITFEGLVSRLAGGFVSPVEPDVLRQTIQLALAGTDLGELDTIKYLPGMVDAAANTLHKLWRSGLDFSAKTDIHPRVRSILSLEAAVLERLPVNMKRPADLAALALPRTHLAHKLFGSIHIIGITEMSPCWRPLLAALSRDCSVEWVAGPRSVPDWLHGTDVNVTTEEPCSPAVDIVSAANAYHEAVEALRWARELVASGKAEPGEIAIASTTPSEYDDHFLALRSDANLDLHFGHGVKVCTTREGQAAAALADIVLRGLSRTRVRRLWSLIGRNSLAFGHLPQGWTQVMPADATLGNLRAWERLVSGLGADDWPDGVDHGAALLEVAAILDGGVPHAAAIGETFLRGQALAIWRKALVSGPAGSLDSTLGTLRVDDRLEPCCSITWIPAASLAACPRKFVRLLGLTSSRWPRAAGEDRLLSDHIIPSEELEPLPVAQADRRDFRTILRTSPTQVVLSRPRRDSGGRLLGRSVLLHGRPDGTYLARNRIPTHAMSETDRLLARADEFARDPQLLSAMAGWNDWLDATTLTRHDGLVRPNHPVIAAVLRRTQSASSLRRLLREPMGFVMRYGMGLRAPKGGQEPLVLDVASFGTFVHETLEVVVDELEASGGLVNQGADAIAACVQRVADATARRWEGNTAVPPAVIWERTLQTAKDLAVNALTRPARSFSGQRSYSEIPFGGQPYDDVGKAFPWDPTVPVVIDGVGFPIAGFIDRVDIAGDNGAAALTDYKSGTTPGEEIILNGGKELQRCLYGFAVRALLGDKIKIEASLLYLSDMVELTLPDADSALDDLQRYLNIAKSSLLAGKAVVGKDSGGEHDDMLFAMPAMAGKAYLKRKLPLAEAALGDATLVWEAK